MTKKVVHTETVLDIAALRAWPTWAKVLVWSGWAVGAFIVVQLVLGSLLRAMLDAGWFAGVNTVVISTVSVAAAYLVALAVILVVPRWLAGLTTSRAELGLGRLPSWLDIGLAPVGLIVYYITSAVLMLVVTQVVDGFDPTQVQNIGFDGLMGRSEYILAFVALVVLAPVAEEVLFRGYLYTRLRRLVPWWATALIVSALFGVAHGQWNVALDTFVLSLFLCGLREITGSVWPTILVHMMKNGLAYYLLFVNPSLIESLGG